jgi:uncharacterized protein (TIGR03067 family)
MRTLFLLATLAMLAVSTQPDQTKELVKFAGTWTPAYVEIDGKELKDDIKNDLLVITGTKYTFTGPKTKMEGVITIDASKTPPTLDVEITGGDNKGVKTIGIYEIAEKQMTVCYRVAPDQRPTSFSTSEKSGRILIIYKRVK